MLITALTVVLGSAHVYLWKRLVKDTTVPGPVQAVLTAALVVLAGLLILTLNLPRLTGRTESPWTAWPGYLWLAVVVYLLLALLAIELVRLALRRWMRTEVELTHKVASGTPPAPPAPTRRVFLARTAALVAGVGSLGMVGSGAATALGRPQVLEVPVRLRRLDPAFNGFRIAVVSDIHLGALLGKRHTERIVNTINETRPDLVAIVGDLVDARVAEIGDAVDPLRDLAPPAGTFFVTGNHEYYVDDTQDWVGRLESLRINLLRNTNTVITRAGATFGLAGVNDLAGETLDEPPDYDRALTGLSASEPIVLLAHQPVMVEEAAARGVDLQISGHSHGGQMWPFHYVVKRVQPSLAGLSTVGETQLYVSRGVGFWGPPVRIGAPPDISVLSLQARGS